MRFSKIAALAERDKTAILPTKEQEKQNLSIAREKLIRLVNADFSGKDYFVLLTYDKEMDAGCRSILEGVGGE